MMMMIRGCRSTVSIGSMCYLSMNSLFPPVSFFMILFLSFFCRTRPYIQVQDISSTTKGGGIDSKKIVYHNQQRTCIILSIRVCFLIISFLCFFLFSPYYNQIFCSLLYISYYTRTHSQKKNDPVLYQFNIRQEEDNDDIVLVLFPFFFVPPTNTHPPTH